MQTLLIMTLVLAGFSQTQEPLVLKREFKAGHENRYAVKLSAAVPIGDVDIQFKSKHKVLKVDKDGNADIEFSTEELAMKVNGEVAPAGSAPPMDTLVFRFDRFGRPHSEAGAAPGTSAFMQLLGFFGESPMELGKKVDYSFGDKSNEKRRTVGTLTLESVKEGEAKLISNWQLFTERSPKPMKIDMTSYVEVKSGIVLRVSGSIVPPASEGVGAQAIQFSMELLRKADGIPSWDPSG